MDLTAIAIGLKAIGAGFVMIGAMGPGLGLGLIGYGAAMGTARNPEASGAILANSLLLGVFAEAIAIYCMLIGLCIIFVMSVVA